MKDAPLSFGTSRDHYHHHLHHHHKHGTTRNEASQKLEDLEEETEESNGSRKNTELSPSKLEIPTNAEKSDDMAHIQPRRILSINRELSSVYNIDPSTNSQNNLDKLSLEKEHKCSLS